MKVAVFVSVALLFAATAAVLVAVLSPGPKSEGERFADQLRLAVQPLQDEYTIPLVQAASENSVLCEYVQPTAGSAECDEYVAAVADANPALLESIDSLEELRSDVPDAFERQVTLFLDDIIEVYTLAFESNQLIVDGWRSQDDSAWERGWQLRDEVIAKAVRVVESLEELQQSGGY